MRDKAVLMRLSVVLLGVGLLWSIGCTQQQERQAEEIVETPTSGKAVIYCDDAVVPLFQPLVQKFEAAYPDAEVVLEPIAARKAVGKLFRGEARAVILCRDYLPDEDSLIRVHKIHFPEITFAKDALVFYAHPDFPLDTISDAQLKMVFQKGVRLEQLFHLTQHLTIVAPNELSSVYANVMKFLTNGKPIRYPLKLLPDADAVYQYVRQHPEALGIGYLSQVALDTTVKMLRVGFVDTTGAYVYPTRYPHQTLIVLGLYPYVVPIRGVLREDIRNLPWGVFMFLERDPQATTYYKDRGIVPSFAIIKIKTGE